MGSSSSSLSLGLVDEDTKDEELSNARDEILKYEDHQELIRNATNDPAEHMEATVESLAPSIAAIVRWYELSERLASDVPEMLAGEETSGSLVATLAFLIDFDIAKQLKPSIQNDFSFVKRANRVVDSGKAGLVSMFIAQSSPMLLRVAAELDATHARRLASLTSSCCAALGDKRLPPQNTDTCVSAMTAAFILYDRSEPGGAFSSKQKKLTSFSLARKVAIAIQNHASDRPSLFGQYRYTTLDYDNKASSAIKKIVEKERD